MQKKAISEIIAAVTIVAITIGLTSTAYIWGAPLIQKRQQATQTQRVFDQFNPTNANSLSKVIEGVANNRGVQTFTIDTDTGVWTLNEADDTIAYSFLSKTSDIATNTQNPISLTPGAQCIPTGPSPASGTQGFDSSSVVCVQATTEADFFRITYKIWFRPVYDNPFSATASGFKIVLAKDPSGLLTSTGKSATITFINSGTQNDGSKTLITKQIQITLV